MSRSATETRTLGESRDPVVYAAAGGFWRVGADSTPQATINECAAATAPGCLRIVVAASMLHHLVVRDADLPLASEAQLQRYALLQFSAIHGAPAEHWPLALWSEWPLQVAAALHGLDLAALQRELRDHAARLAGVAPSWSRAWAAAHRADRDWSACGERALLWVEGGLGVAASGAGSPAPRMPWATWIAADRRGLRSFRQRRLADRSAQAAGALADELAAADPVPAQQVLIAGYGLAGELDGGPWRNACDLRQPLPEPRWLLG